MSKILILLALLSFSIGCNIKIEPTSSNVQVSQNGNSITVSQNNPSNSANNSTKPANSTEPTQKGNTTSQNKDFDSKYLNLAVESHCTPVDESQTGVRMVEDKCGIDWDEGLYFTLWREFGDKYTDKPFASPESGRVWSISVLDDANKKPFIPKANCSATGDKMPGYSWGDNLELRLWRGRPFAAIVRVRCHIQPDKWGYEEHGMDPSLLDRQTWKVSKEYLVVRGIDPNDTIQDFDIDTKTTPNANEAARQRAENAYLEMVEKGR